MGAEHAPEIDPFIANNLTVIKDAGAIKYGTDALGGVIVVNPAELPADQKLGGELHLIGNSNGRAGTISGLLEGGIKNAKAGAGACKVLADVRAIRTHQIMCSPIPALKK